MERCFICYKKIEDDIIYIPRDEEYFGEDISIFKNTFIIKTIYKYKFLYYTTCNYCLDKYLSIYKNTYNYLKYREINKKIKIKKNKNIKYK